MEPLPCRRARRPPWATDSVTRREEQHQHFAWAICAPAMVSDRPQLSLLKPAAQLQTKSNNLSNIHNPQSCQGCGPGGERPVWPAASRRGSKGRRHRLFSLDIDPTPSAVTTIHLHYCTLRRTTGAIGIQYGVSSGVSGKAKVAAPDPVQPGSPPSSAAGPLRLRLSTWDCIFSVVAAGIHGSLPCTVVCAVYSVLYGLLAGRVEPMIRYK
jgi:hypothetical protein